MALFARKPAPPAKPLAPLLLPITFDSTGGHPALREADACFNRGDWQTVHDQWAESYDWETRHAVLDRALKHRELVDEWLAAVPDHTYTATLRGRLRILQAWEVRGSGKADTVERDAWTPFQDLLHQSEEDLFAAAEGDPEDPSPWSFLLMSGMGLGVSVDERLRRFEEADARATGFYDAHFSVIRAVSKKWGGSHKAMFDVASDALAKLPAGSHGQVAMLEAHNHRQEYYRSWEKDADAAKDYWKRPEVGTDVEAAARRSIDDPAFARGSVNTNPLLSYFSYAFAFSGDANPDHRLRAAWIFDALGDVNVTGEGWTQRWSRDAAMAKYVRVRDICRRGAAAHAGPGRLR